MSDEAREAEVEENAVLVKGGVKILGEGGEVNHEADPIKSAQDNGEATLRGMKVREGSEKEQLVDMTVGIADAGRGHPKATISGSGKNEELNFQRN